MVEDSIHMRVKASALTLSCLHCLSSSALGCEGSGPAPASPALPGSPPPPGSQKRTPFGLTQKQMLVMSFLLAGSFAADLLQVSEAKLEDFLLLVVLSEGQAVESQSSRLSKHNIHRVKSLLEVTHSWGREGFRKGSESLPLTTLALRCLGSEVEATEREGAAGLGGFLLARSFLCRSISSLCWLMLSCCLHGSKSKTRMSKYTRAASLT